MKVCLQLGGIRIQIDSTFELEVDEMLPKFVIPFTDNPDVTFRFTLDFEQAERPDTPPLGIDALLRHYRQGDRCFCIAKGGREGDLAVTEYAPDFSYVRCAVDESRMISKPISLTLLLRFCPMVALFQHFGVIFLHASQAVYRDKGLVFTAPSGTGKTTQALLWSEHRAAKRLCNDRTLIRRTREGWMTYGYPIDGSSPIGSNECTRLGAVMLLWQSPENRLERLSPFKMAALLMPQMVIDTWNPDARVRAMDALLELLGEVNVYRFGCTPDAEAVNYLEDQLISDGVYENG